MNNLILHYIVPSPLVKFFVSRSSICKVLWWIVIFHSPKLILLFLLLFSGQCCKYKLIYPQMCCGGKLVKLCLFGWLCYKYSKVGFGWLSYYVMMISIVVCKRCVSDVWSLIEAKKSCGGGLIADFWRANLGSFARKHVYVWARLIVNNNDATLMHLRGQTKRSFSHPSFTLVGWLLRCYYVA